MKMQLQYTLYSLKCCCIFEWIGPVHLLIQTTILLQVLALGRTRFKHKEARDKPKLLTYFLIQSIFT